MWIRTPRHQYLTVLFFLLASMILAACVPAPSPTPTSIPTIDAAAAAEVATAEPAESGQEEAAAETDAEADAEPAESDATAEMEGDAQPEDESASTPDDAAAEEPTEETESSESEPTASDSVAFNSWTINQLYGMGTLGGVPVTAEFISDSELTGWTGCNDFEATFETASGETIQVTELALTSDNLCRSEAATTQELLFQKALMDAGTYELSGADLTLFDASGAPVLTMRNAVTLELDGTSWSVTGYDDTLGEFVPVIPDGPALSMMLRENAVNGFSGCNNYAGSTQVSGNSIAIDNVSNSGSGSGSARCEGDSPFINQEAAYRKALTIAATWEIAGPHLTFLGEGGNPVVTYLAGPAQEDATP